MGKTFRHKKTYFDDDYDNSNRNTKNIKKSKRFKNFIDMEKKKRQDKFVIDKFEDEE